MTTAITQRFTRRQVLGGALAAAGASAAAACVPEPPQRSVRRRVVVIGTGFGGSVTARRLAEAGVEVTLVERGRRWPAGVPGTFPTMFGVDRRVSWLSSANSATALFPSVPLQPYTGLLERIKGDGMDVVVAAAVGGGSLPYHGMSVQPRGDLFARVMPGELDYDEFDRRWYPLVRAALGASPIPADVLASDRYASSRAFIEAVRAAGFPDARGEPMPIDWDIVRRELRGELPPNVSVGDVIYGVNGPGKRSLDTNYLPAAEATGRVELLAQHRVSNIARDRNGRWVVPTERIDTDGVVHERVELVADALFLCAGSPNTTRLLVNAAGTGTIADLPDDVGRWWSTNGDLIVMQVLDHPTGTMQGGPASIASRDWDNPAGPMSLLFAPLPVPVDIGAMQTVAIFLPYGHGAFQYDARRGDAHLSFPASAHGASMAEARRRLARLGRAAGSIASGDMTAA
ncbi:MAG TPA: FAD-dependent oxidoreductase, partial [Microthrixaceae bacterium]|nr:FAD-dependent oxidoreductase [Microthrixaceae bacterium]